jgi:Domain of unknown function (DUF4261)
MRPLSVEIYCNELGGADPEVVRADLAGRVPAPISVLVEARAPRLDSLEDALSQSWQFPEARDTLRQCRFVITARETMASPAKPVERLLSLQEAVSMVLNAVQGEAMHCVDSQQVISPGLFLGEVEARGFPALQAGAVNVRLYRVDAPGVAEGRLIMDTLGLHALGLPDLQIDYRWLEPGAVARTLFAAAGYIFQQGDVIEDGHSIEGSLPGTRWSAQHTQSTVEPPREVIALDPGEPYSTRDE